MKKFHFFAIFGEHGSRRKSSLFFLLAYSSEYIEYRKADPYCGDNAYKHDGRRGHFSERLFPARRHSRLIETIQRADLLIEILHIFLINRFASAD